MKKYFKVFVIFSLLLFTPNIFAQASQSCIPPPSGMVAWWSLDETCGTTSNDLAQFNNAGTQVNGPVPVAGKVLGGLQFDGINDYIEVPDHSELNFGTGNFSIDAWVRTNQSTGQLTIVNKIQFSANRGYSLYLSNGELRLILIASSNMFYVSSVQVADGNWHHIAVTVDRADPSGIKFYKDGIMLSTSDPTTNPGTITTISPLRIGSLSWVVGDMFKGTLDEIELFNRVLTPQEVSSIYSADIYGKCKPATISGIKYNDINGDGSNLGDLGIANWTINLEYLNGAGTLVTQTATTCANGDYIFTGLSAGTYTVSETQQGGWTQTAPVTPGTYTIVLTAGQNSINNNFGNKQLSGSICGMKYNDINGNGSKNSGDLGLANWTINLKYLNGAGTLVTQTASTDANGNYCFTNLTANTYTVSETPQGGWTQTAPAIPGTYTIVLTTGQNSINNDFGNKQLFGSICGMKYNDINGNGSKNSGDLGLANWIITLEYLNGAGTIVTQTASTDANGNYCFTNLTANTYTVSETPQGGWTQTAPATPGTYTIVLAAGQNSINNDFGNKQLFGSICGMKYNDINGNGSKNSGDLGLANWTITLEYLNGAGVPVTQTVTTDANGNYCFTNLTANTYRLSETQQSGWTQTAPAAPGVYTIVLTAGQNSINNDFGNKPITGCVEPPFGMVAWYPLDETLGATVVKDIIGTNNGTPIPGPINVMGSAGGPIPGSTLSFLQPPFMVDGSLYFYAGAFAKYVRVPNNTSLNFGSGDFSIDAWVYPVVGANYVQPIVDKSVTTLTVCIGYRLFILNGQLNFVVMDGSNTSVTIAPITYSQWQHVVAVRRGGNPNIIQLYRNGTLITTSTPLINNISNTTDLIIGGIPNPSGGIVCGLPAVFNFGEIAIDELEIFNRAITPAEIFSIWNAGTFGKCKPLTDVQENEQVPVKIELMQSYPNPFNPSTIIRYEIPKMSFVNISVYNILGREIKVLVNEEKGPGRYEITFDAKELASGIYFYTIRTGNFSQSKKMILMK